MNTHWIYSVPASLAIAAFLAWPVSQQDAKSLFERVRFCLLSMIGFALLIWGFQQKPEGVNGQATLCTVEGLVVGVTAAAFLIMLWFDKVIGMMADTFLGCLDFPDDSSSDPKFETKQMEQAVHLFRLGKRRRALRLCNRIIESNSQYTASATTLAHWVENPCSLRFHRPPRTSIRFKGRSSN